MAARIVEAGQKSTLDGAKAGRSGPIHSRFSLPGIHAKMAVNALGFATFFQVGNPGAMEIRL
jgi:hypothetical protein